MRKIKIYCLFLVYVCMSQFSIAQIVKTDYFMQTSTLRLQHNPALRPEQGYLTVPVIPNVSTSLQTNSLNLDKLTFAGPEGRRVTFIHPSIGDDQFLSGMSKNNYINADINVKLFSYGFYKGEGFWSIDLGARTHADANIPKGFFELIKKGFDNGTQTKYVLSNMNATGTSFGELGVAYSRPLMDGLIVGARAKFLAGFADFDFNAKHFEMDAGFDHWTSRSQVTLKGSAPGVKPKYNGKNYLDGFDFDGFNITGYGAGLDLGATYELKNISSSLDGFRLSAAVNDIGFISWTKSNSLSLSSPDVEVIITPNDYTITNGENASSLSDLFDDMFDDIKKATNLTGDGNKGRSTMLRMNVIAGLEYDILTDKLSAGAVYSSRFGNYFTTSELTAILNGRPCSWISTSISCSFLHSDFDTFGAALHIAPRKGLTFFVASDYIIPHVSSDFLPTTSKALNLQFGMSIPLGSAKKKLKISRNVSTFGR